MDRINLESKQVQRERNFNPRWLLKMAWRDSRRSRSRLFLFISSIILGIAALVAIYSLGDNLQQEVDNQAASLLGADLELSANRKPEATVQHFLDSLGVERSYQQNFASMILFPKNGGTRLIQVRALQGDFPYYGILETMPTAAAKNFRTSQQAIVDETLMLQYDAEIGDSIRIGEMTFAIAGKLMNVPGQTGLSASVAPIVFIPMQYMKQTGLAQKGSRINYRYYYKFAPGTNADELVEKIRPKLEANELNYETIASQKEDTGRTFTNLTMFLSLVGFIALLLGCTGVASAVHVYVKEKVNTIAILRCLGGKASQAFAIFLLQIVITGLLGSLLGVALGIGIQQLLPFVVQDLLPVKVHTPVSWPAVGQGLVLGFVISALFALLPLLAVRKISPLNALRSSVDPPKMKQDGWRWLIYLLIAGFVYGFTLLQVKSPLQALWFILGIGGALLVLLLIARALTWSVRRFFPSSWSYLWRQGLANLYRPNNQTTILIVSIGLGTALICTLLFVQSVLVNRITLSTSENQPNIVLFDIQSKQEDSVTAIAAKFGLPVRERVPIVNMRLEEVNGIDAARARKDSTVKLSRWLFSREYRVTYRDSLTQSEKITEGKWQGKFNGNVLPEISLEQNFAKRSGVELGDTVTFNVQGSLMKTLVGSFREVNWGGIQTNFVVVFPTGLLEAAPQFHVLLSRVPSQQVSADFQRAVVKAHPNVSIIDLGLVLKVLDDLLNKIGFVIRFMAGFSIVTGIVVLISSVLISKYQRLQESVLLRTLGGSRRQIFIITALEYFFLGALAALTGILLALAASWALAKYFFETPFHPDFVPVATLFVLVCLITVVTGLLNSRGFLNRSPLEVLRADG